MTPRPSRPGDEPGLKALWSAVFGDTEAFIDTFFRAVYTPGMAAVAERDGQIVSAAYRVPFGPYAYIYAVGTLPAYRGRGLGRAVTLAAAGGGPAYLLPASPGLRAWYERSMGAKPAGLVFPAELPRERRPVSAEEFAARREDLLAGVPHAVYSPGLLELFSLEGAFYAGPDGSVYAAEGDTALEALPLRGEGEKKLLGLNGAPEVCWGLTFQ